MPIALFTLIMFVIGLILKTLGLATWVGVFALAYFGFVLAFLISIRPKTR